MTKGMLYRIVYNSYFVVVFFLQSFDHVDNLSSEIWLKCVKNAGEGAERQARGVGDNITESSGWICSFSPQISPQNGHAVCTHMHW